MVGYARPLLVETCWGMFVFMKKVCYLCGRVGRQGLGAIAEFMSNFCLYKNRSLQNIDGYEIF